MALIDKKLTDRDESASAKGNTLFHMVDVEDISQSPEGSSYKITKANLLKESGEYITVENPATSSETSLNQALIDIYDSASDTGFVENISFQDSNTAIVAQTYVIELYAQYGYAIDELKVISGAGTCTVAVKINGTNVTGISAVAVSTTISTGTATALNTVVVGDKITLVVSSPTTLENLQASLKTTRT